MYISKKLFLRYSQQDLVASAEEEKNYKGMCIAFVVIGAICSLIIVSIILLTPGLSI